MPSPSTFHGSVQTPCVTQFFFSEHLGATFGRNRTELGWLKLALLGTIAGGAGAFVLHWVGLVDMSWEWQTPRMHFFPIFTIKLSLYDKKTAMKNLGKDFFWHQTLPWRWEFPLPPGCWQVTTTEKCRLLDHSWFFCNSSIFEFLKDPESKTPTFYLFSTFWTAPFFLEAPIFGVEPSTFYRDFPYSNRGYTGFLPCWIGSLWYPDIVTQNWLPISSLPSPKKDTQGAPKTCDTALPTWESMVSR